MTYFNSGKQNMKWFSTGKNIIFKFYKKMYSQIIQFFFSNLCCYRIKSYLDSKITKYIIWYVFYIYSEFISNLFRPSRAKEKFYFTFFRLTFFSWNVLFLFALSIEENSIYVHIKVCAFSPTPSASFKARHFLSKLIQTATTMQLWCIAILPSWESRSLKVPASGLQEL